jgi:hypothetical protein
MKANGLKEPSNRNHILGITETDTVMLDLDEMPFKTVKYWAKRICHWHKLKGFIIRKSSKNCYHVVFDRKVTWEENVKIMAWVCLLSHHVPLFKWFLMQAIKQGSTLRVSNKLDKPSPRTVFRYGSQKDRIADYLAFGKRVKGITKKLDSDNSL